ncbi:oligosaccharide flippase family protein [bacterium]|nr:oligosaccharide flippase family protein [bacterium]
MIKSKNIFHSLLKSEIFRNTSILISGTAIAQLIPILLQPVLRRYYTPETFGAYAVYTSLIGILYVLSSFRYEMAIIHPKKDKIAANLLVLSQGFNLIFNFGLFIVIYFFNDKILEFLNISPKYSIFIYLVPLGTLLYNFYQSTHYWLIREKAFFAVSVNKFVRRGTEGTLQIVFKFVFQQFGLILGDIFGHFVNCLSGIIQSKKKRFSINGISTVKIKYVSKKYLEYPKYNMISSFMGVFSLLAPTLIINKFFSSEYAGYYDLSKLVLSIPLALIAGSIANVLLQHFSEKKRNKISIKGDFLIVFIGVLIIAILEILVINLFGTRLFSLFFGSEWEISGTISKILVWSYAINFIAFSFSSVFISLEKIKLLSVWQLFHFIAIIVLIFFKNLDFNYFIRLYVLIEIICFTFNFILLFLIVKKYEKKILIN